MLFDFCQSYLMCNPTLPDFRAMRFRRTVMVTSGNTAGTRISRGDESDLCANTTAVGLVTEWQE